MHTQRNHYEVLGLPRTATTEEIKKRYRELARKYHPDVVGNKGTSQKTFVQITTAYKTLVDKDKRAEYDNTLGSAPAAGNGPISAAGSGPASGYAAGTSRQASSYHYPSSPVVEALLSKAERSFSLGEYDEAAAVCRDAIAMDRQNARAHALLGSVYQLQGKVAQAVSELSLAVQFNPSDTESKIKLEKLKKLDPSKAKRARSRQPQSGDSGSLLGKIKTLFQK